MSFSYDHTDKSEFSNPVVNAPTRVTIIGCESATSQSSGKPMQVLQVKVDQGEEGAGYTAKEYLVKGVNWKIRQVMESCGLDPETDREITDVLFLERKALVTFKAEEWAGNDGNLRTSYKIDKWVPRSEATIPLAPDPAKGVDDVQAPSEPVDNSDIPF